MTHIFLSENPDVSLIFANGGKFDVDGLWDSAGVKAYCYFNQVTLFIISFGVSHEYYCIVFQVQAGSGRAPYVLTIGNSDGSVGVTFMGHYPYLEPADLEEQIEHYESLLNFFSQFDENDGIALHEKDKEVENVRISGEVEHAPEVGKSDEGKGKDAVSEEII
jgi:hypothetical protein